MPVWFGDSHLQVKFREVFDAFDDDQSGTLEPAELRKLIKRLLPNVTEAEVRYFGVRTTDCWHTPATLGP